MDQIFQVNEGFNLFYPIWTEQRPGQRWDLLEKDVILNRRYTKYTM